MTPGMDSYYRRPLPATQVAFGAPEGKRLLSEALSEGTAEAFFPLVAHLHTQAEVAWCGLGTLVTVLNALEIDPGRVWKGPWRWFGEELLVCCKALEVAAAEGLTLAEVGCLAQCNGAHTAIEYADAGSLAVFRAALAASVRTSQGPFVVANYARGELGQSGGGHFSPLAAWHQGEDKVLVLDVARFKYPPHWVAVEQLWSAMIMRDEQSGRARGWLVVRRGEGPPAIQGAAALVDRLQTLGAPCCPVPPRPSGS